MSTKKTRPRMLIVTLFVIFSHWKLSKSRIEWINTLRLYTHNGILCSNDKHTQEISKNVAWKSNKEKSRYFIIP
jgi:hypothetical protein